MQRLAPETEDLCEFFCVIYDFISFIHFFLLKLDLRSDDGGDDDDDDVEQL